MPFRALFAVPVIALLGIIGIWYTDREDQPSPVGAAAGAVVYLEAEVVGISRWAGEPGATGYYGEGFDEISLSIDDAFTLDPSQGFLGFYRPGSGALVRMSDADLDVGDRYGFYLFVPQPEDQFPLWISYVHDLETDRPSRGFLTVEGSDGQLAEDVLDCLVQWYTEDDLALSRMGAMNEAMIEMNLYGASNSLASCEVGV